MRILAVCGSLQTHSSNRTLMVHAQEQAPEGVTVILFTGLATLPHFNPDLETGGTLPEVDALRHAVASADALLIACPEYGFSLPGALKNAVDWLIGTGELERKRVAITASVAHAERGLRGLAALRTTLSAVSAEVMFDGPVVRDGDAGARIAEIFTALAAERPGEQRG